VRAPGAATQGDPWELATEVGPRPVLKVPVEQETPTRIDTSGPAAAVVAALAGEAEQATPTELTARPERSEPVRVISMKHQVEAGMPRTPVEQRVPLHLQLRTIAEVAGIHEAAGLGRLAPPHDPRQARKRRRLANLAWAGVAVVLAAGISIAIWLIAGR
jgi:hypothetical protein